MYLISILRNRARAHTGFIFQGRNVYKLNSNHYISLARKTFSRDIVLFEGIQVLGGVVMGMGASINIDGRAVSNLFGNIYDE